MSAKQTTIAVKDPAHPLWDRLRADVHIVYRLPYGIRELISGRTRVVTVQQTQASIFDTAAREHAREMNPDQPPTVEGAYELIPVVEIPPEPPSERELAAEKIASLVKAANLTSPYGGDVLRHVRGRYYAVAFTSGRLLTGIVKVFSPEYIVVHHTADGRLGIIEHATRMYKTVDHALEYIALAFHVLDWKRATAVPERPPTERKNRHDTGRVARGSREQAEG